MWFALSLTFIAGMATFFGGLLSTHKRILSRGTLAVALGFATGAMLFVSFTDILTKSLDAFSALYGDKNSYLMMLLTFTVGLLVMVVIDKLIPSDINLSDQEGNETKAKAIGKKRLMHSGIFIAIALCLHNFPEGFLVFMSGLDDPESGTAIAFALAIHNIPEGIAVAAPIYATTKSRFKSVGIATLTGIAEPIGALIGYFILRDHLTDTVYGWVFGIVAGMMVFICVNELIPAAKRYETNRHQTMYGIIAGMVVIGFSLALFR